MIFQLSDWFPKPMIWAIIVKFDQIRKNWWRISCAEILEVGKNFFAESSVKKMSRFEEVSPKKIKRIAWKFTKTVILLGLAGYELIIWADNNELGLRPHWLYVSAHIRHVLEEYLLIIICNINNLVLQKNNNFNLPKKYLSTGNMQLCKKWVCGEHLPILDTW